MPLPQTKWEQMVDRAMQTCIKVFGEGEQALVQITHLTGFTDMYERDAIYEGQSLVVDPGTQLKIMSNQPQISFRVSELMQMPDVDDEFVVRGVLYRADAPIFDGHGTVTIPLGRLS